MLRDGEARVPKPERDESLTVHLEKIQDLYQRCKGNLVRVAEELAAGGIVVQYSTLTGFCRRHGIGVVIKQPAGQYHFEPGEEMQHDTSPHVVTLDGKSSKLQCASLVLCYSRRIYAQVYPRWTRFEARVFLSEALAYFGGACRRAMIDNSSVVIGKGTGADAIPAPEMAALAKRFGFRFVAHRVGDANRSARVERPFHYIENNFYPGRSFADLADCNLQLRAWCGAVDQKRKRHLGATPLQLFAAEQPCLVPLPIHIPAIYVMHSRRVDVEAFVTLHTNRYSVPAKLIGRQLEIRETMDTLRIFDGHDLIVEHQRIVSGQGMRVTLPEHHVQRLPAKPATPSSEERTLQAVHEVLGELCQRLRKRHGGQALRAVRRLHRMYLEYPTEPLCAAIAEALEYELIDLTRIERMALRRIAGDFFKLPIADDPDDPEDPDDR